MRGQLHIVGLVLRLTRAIQCSSPVLVFPAKEELVSKRRPGAARPPCVVRDAPSALLTMTYVVDSIEEPPHPEEAATRLSRRTHRADPAILQFPHEHESRDPFSPWAPAGACPRAGHWPDPWAGVMIFSAKPWAADAWRICCLGLDNSIAGPTATMMRASRAGPDDHRL